MKVGRSAVGRATVGLLKMKPEHQEQHAIVARRITRVGRFHGWLRADWRLPSGFRYLIDYRLMRFDSVFRHTGIACFAVDSLGIHQCRKNVVNSLAVNRQSIGFAHVNSYVVSHC